MLAAVAAIVMLAAACSGDPLANLQSDDYVIFGDFYGECIGDSCIDIYKIQNGQVYEDTLDLYPTATRLPHETAFVPTSRDSYDEIEQRLAEMPSDLYTESKVVIGQPDAGDWGGFYLETRIDGEIRFWLIDKLEDNLPAYLRSFTTKLDEAIALAEDG